MRAEIGTPCGSCQCGEIEGHCWAGEVKRELGWATTPSPGCHAWPCQSRVPAGGVLCSGSMPSHHGCPSGVRPTLVKMLLLARVGIAFGVVCALVPGANPKKR